VEPGYFRTDFLDESSLTKTKSQIDDYAATVGEMRRFAAGASHKQPGDPAKLAKAMLQLVDSDEPPVRLPLGTDTVAKLREKNAFVESELQQWLRISVSTDHDDTRTRGRRRSSNALDSQSSPVSSPSVKRALGSSAASDEEPLRQPRALNTA